MKHFAIRNLKLFFRDKSAVFFSLLSVFIIIGLYVLFLGDMMVNNMTEIKDARFLMDSWIMAGLLGITSMTTTMGAFGVMVDDRAKKIAKDFFTSPLKRSSVAGGYIVSTLIIGVLMSLVALVLAELYIISSGGEILPVSAAFETLALIVLAVISSSSMVFLAVSFFKSQNAFAAASTVIGTLAGFLTGIYIPVGNLPSAVQLVVKVFPVSHAAVLFRQVFMKVPIEAAFSQAPALMEENFRKNLGVVFEIGDTALKPVWSILYLIVATVVFYTLAVINISRKKNR